MKWACCGVSAREKWRFEQLQSVLGGEHSLTVLEYKPDLNWQNELKEFGHVRWGEMVQVPVTKTWPVQSTWTALLGVTDGVVFRDSQWWPLCAAYEAIGQTITGIGEGLDMQASAFISGTNGSARAAIGALFRAGFRKFRVLPIDFEMGSNLLQEVHIKFFGIDVELVPPEKIVLLAGVSSIFVNNLTEEEAPELVKEISYMNFLKRPGAIIDTSLYSKQTVLLKEAVESEIPTVDGWSIAARVDALWAEWAFNKKIDIAAYEKQLREGAASIEAS